MGALPLSTAMHPKRDHLPRLGAACTLRLLPPCPCAGRLPLPLPELALQGRPPEDSHGGCMLWVWWAFCVASCLGPGLHPSPLTPHLHSPRAPPIPFAPLAHLPQGVNSTVFAYGQTGSGKTHTMLGSNLEEEILTSDTLEPSPGW